MKVNYDKIFPASVEATDLTQRHSFCTHTETAVILKSNVEFGTVILYLESSNLSCWTSV